MVDMENAFCTLQSWETGKGLIVYGSGQTFCSGGDLNMARMFSNPDDGFRMATYMQDVLDQLENLPLLTVALIEGTGKLSIYHLRVGKYITVHNTVVILLVRCYWRWLRDSSCM